MGKIGAWVLKQASKDAMSWPEHVRVAVNVSPAQFRRRALELDVFAALGESGLTPNRLEIEITESVLLEDTEASIATLERIHAFGVKIAMDDFSTGYSSLSYLQKFPFDKIKIDKSFISRCKNEREQRRDRSRNSWAGGQLENDDDGGGRRNGGSIPQSFRLRLHGVARLLFRQAHEL